MMNKQVFSPTEVFLRLPPSRVRVSDWSDWTGCTCRRDTPWGKQRSTRKKMNNICVNGGCMFMFHLCKTVFFPGAQQRNHQQLWNLRPTYVSLIFFVFVSIGNKHAPAIDMFNRIIIYQEIQCSTELWLFQIDPTACESKFGECSAGNVYSVMCRRFSHMVICHASSFGDCPGNSEFHWVPHCVVSFTGMTIPPKPYSGYMDKLGMVAVAIGFTTTWRIAWKVCNWKRVVKEFSTGSDSAIPATSCNSFFHFHNSFCCMYLTLVGCVRYTRRQIH